MPFSGISSHVTQPLIFALVASAFANIYITQPVLPVLASEFKVDAAVASLTVSATVLGIALANLPFGQGESVTPMQMVAAYDAIANDNILRAPYVVQSINGKPERVPSGHRIITASTTSELRDMLRGVFADGGTASGAEIRGYDMTGKTGVAAQAGPGRVAHPGDLLF